MESSLSLLFVSAFSDGLIGQSSNPVGKWDVVPTFNPIITAAASLRWTGEPVSRLADSVVGTHRRKLVRAADRDDYLIVGMAVRFPVGPITGDGDGNSRGISLMGDSGATQHLCLLPTNTGAWRVRRGSGSGTILATSADGVISVATWHYIEIGARLHDSTGEVIVRVDNTEVINATGLDTKNGGTDTLFHGVDLGRFGTDSHMTDVYIANEAGSINNDFLGDMRVHTLFPDTEGALIEWTPSTGTDNSDTIDDGTTPPNTTDFNSSDVDGDIDRFNMEALGVDSASVVHGVQVATYASKDDAGARSLRHNILSDASVATGDDHVLSTTWRSPASMFELDPDGSVAWTPAQVDAAEIGYEVRP